MELYRKVKRITEKYENINDAVETNVHIKNNLYIYKKGKIHITYRS
jgi:hypothetical protein